MNPDQSGATLVELLVAVAIIGVALIPLLQIVPATLAPIQVSDTEVRLSAAGVRKSEELTHRLRANIASVTSGAEACSDLSGCRLEWTIATDASSSAPGVGSLVAVEVVACRDADASGACDPAEDQVRYATKVTSRP
ncbi:MAG: prepilin-type N-terminal cleavage/methylation domain-containing protein [Armatimonadota bacterium]|nr:prepilin-type N-terminal cleavage/methylation domain-containing protein [Armatimonadota bacterium]